MYMFQNLFKKTDYKKLLEDGAIVIDVRNPGEFSMGALPGSENIPLATLGGRVNQIKERKVAIICVCASGMRSGIAKGQLKSAGIEAYNAGAWTKLIPHFE